MCVCVDGNEPNNLITTLKLKTGTSIQTLTTQLNTGDFANFVNLG